MVAPTLERFRYPDGSSNKREALNLLDHNPLFALNEGVLLSQNLMATLGSTSLGRFLHSRIMPLRSGIRFALTRTEPHVQSLRMHTTSTVYKENEEDPEAFARKLRHFDSTEWYTAIGLPYYAANHGDLGREAHNAKELSVQQRSDVLRQHVIQDYSLFISSHGEIPGIQGLEALQGPDRLRAHLATMQILINDISGVVYALHLAQTLGSQYGNETFLQDAQEVEMAYYQTIFHIMNPQQMPVAPDFPVQAAQRAFSQADDILTQMDNFFSTIRIDKGRIIHAEQDHIAEYPAGMPDYIRTAREIEGPVVLEAALLIAKELSQRTDLERQHIILIAGLGPIAMRAALPVAFGVYGITPRAIPIVYSVADVKVINPGEEKRDTHVLPLSQNFVEQVNSYPGQVIIHNIDDSGGTLATLEAFIERQQDAFNGHVIETAYVVQGNDRGTDKGHPIRLHDAIERIIKNLGIDVTIFFRAPVRKGGMRGDRANFPRFMTLLWARKNARLY